MTDREEQLVNDLSKFMGLPPYDNDSNVCYNDNSYYQGLIQKYGKRMVNRIETVVQGGDYIPITTSTVQRVIEQPRVEKKDNSKLGELLQKMRDKKLIEEVKVEKITLDEDIQDSIDAYIEMHEQYRKLEKQLEQMKSTILEPFMVNNGIKELKGSNGGKVQIVEQLRPQVSAQFTSYEVEDVEQFLSVGSKRKCLVKRVDRDILEALVKTGEVDEGILDLKVTSVQAYIKVDHR